MAYLLRGLLLLMVAGVILTMLTAFGLVELSLNHIQIAIPVFLYTIFAQAFVMFYFIGVSRLINNIWTIFSTSTNLSELFDNPPKTSHHIQKKLRNLFMTLLVANDRQSLDYDDVSSWHDCFSTRWCSRYKYCRKTTHSGVVYGFFVAMMIGFVRQWYYLGQSHVLLRKVKTLFEIPDAQM